MAEITSYSLSRKWFDWCFDNPELITPNHSALYFFIIEHNNRLGWKEKFGLPMEMAKDAIGIKNYRTYSKTFNELEEWGFIKVIQRSKNQYSANIIALVENTKAQSKALDKAMQKHSQKQVHGIVCIDKHINNTTIEPITKEQPFRKFAHLSIFKSEYDSLASIYTSQKVDSILDSIQNYSKNTTYKSLYLTAKKWLEKDYEQKPQGTIAKTPHRYKPL